MGGFLSHLLPEVNSEILQASCGPIKGNVYKHNYKIVEGYLGIPYAKPPVGDLRFRKPEPADLWLETKDCTKYGPICPQTGGFPSFDEVRKTPVDEANCLNLNVFVPKWESTEFKCDGRPVMVFVHGGGFELSTSADYCAYSLSGTLPLKDVIIVTFNYRLGVLGFLTTGSEECKGNFGLWDQTLALKWVQKHIKSFGGNPDNVTVFGQSAGGASTDFLSLSPHSRDLFHKFIPMSGSAMCDFAIRTNANQTIVFREFAKHLGFDGNVEDPATLLEFYTATDSKDLTNIKGFKHPISGSLTFVPNFDGDFFPKPLDQLRKEAPKKPMMIGICEYEGLMLGMIDPEMKNPVDQIKKMAKKLFGADVVKNPETIQRQVYEAYTNGADLSCEDVMNKKLVELVGDQFFNFGILESARSAAKYGHDVYLYSFEYCPPDSFGIFSDMVPFEAATHGTELRFILGDGLYSKFQPSEDDFTVLGKMTTIFTNFSKYGNPNDVGSFDWERYNLENQGRHYRISLPVSEMREVFQENRCDLFDEIYKHNKSYQEIVYGRISYPDSENDYHDGRCNYVEEIQGNNNIYENIVFGK